MHCVKFQVYYRSLLGLFFIAGLSACSGSSEDSVIVEGDVPIAYVKRPTNALGDPTLAISFTAGGNLYIREQSSPSSPEINVTGSLTQGVGDVSDPEVSYDGSKIVFSMRLSDAHTWGVWEYNIADKSLTPISCTVSSGATPAGDDVDPAYLPDGRIVFASNRQEKSRRVMVEQYPVVITEATAFSSLDEYERERAITLHVMNADGSDCRQISFNQSHDRNPTVLQTGEVMFSRWDHVGERNQFSIFTTNPDGTNLFVFYGAHSPGNSYLHPRELPNGQILSTLMPLSGTNEGGALMQINVREYSEDCEPGPGAPIGCNGQEESTAQPINFGMGISRYGRFSTPYPLWDGTNRALVAWTPSCAAVDRLNCPTEPNPLTGAPVREEATPVYGIYMLNLGDKSMRPVVTAPPGYAVLDPIAIQPRPLPNPIADKQLDDALAIKPSAIGTTGVGILDVKSVYDSDSRGRMGNEILVNGESIPTLPSTVPDIARLKDPALTTAAQRPARFIRVTKAVPTQQGTSRLALGETDYEMQQILGYAEVEPDGSFKIEVPADVPLAIAVLDKNGRGFTPHTSWLQVRPGETRTCNGCHSPRRGPALNTLPITGTHPNTLLAGTGGESMAETRARLLNVPALQLNENIEYSDVWTNPTVRAIDPPINIRYTGNQNTDGTANTAEDLTTRAPATSGPNRGVIDYPEHIQPLWTKPRQTTVVPPAVPQDRTCTSCHSNTDALNLSATVGGSGRLISYDELLVGDPVLDDSDRPIIDVIDDELVVRREEAQVITGESRTSHLIEVLFHQELKSPSPLPTLDHSSLLNRAEKRLVAEWIDLGAQYYNSPRDSNNVFRGVTGLSEDVFGSSVYPILLTHCSSCHRAVGQPGSGASPGFVGRRFVLTGQREGDFNVTLSMIGDRSDPAGSELLRRPSSNGIPPNPVHGQAIGGGPVMPTTDPNYQCITNWIRGTGC